MLRRRCQADPDKETVKAHFEKERQLFSQGIKILSLFFIDEVKNTVTMTKKMKKAFMRVSLKKNMKTSVRACWKTGIREQRLCRLHKAD